jgi:hypothetical protein
VRIAVTDTEAKQQAEQGGSDGGAVTSSLDLEARCEAIIASLPPPSALTGFTLQPIDFDKDVDAHM